MGGGWFTQERLAELAERTWYVRRYLDRQDAKRVFNSWFLILEMMQRKEIKGVRIDCEKEFCSGQPWCCGRHSHRIHISSLALLAPTMLGPVSQRLKEAAVRSAASTKAWRKRHVA